jgi:hypothetical protein
MPKQTIHAPDGSEIEIEEIPPGIDPAEFVRRKIAECPECQAAIARGETPEIIHAVDLTREQRQRHPLFARRPRWRKVKGR